MIDISALSRGLALAAMVSAGCAAPWLTASPDSARRLAGPWTGWMMMGWLGNGPATMTVRDNGTFDGVLRLADGDRPFHGAISVLGPRTMRYDGTFGDGKVTLDEDTLKLLPDGGGGVATFVPAK